nr:Glucose-repressible alcohol dehydrogenase transcriptional effector [Polyrhizophydium stewartii]
MSNAYPVFVSGMPPRFPQMHFQKMPAPPGAQAMGHPQHMLHYANGQIAMAQASTLGAASLGLGGPVAPHLRIQLDQAHAARMSSTPHYHARIHASTARSGLATSSSNLNLSANGIAANGGNGGGGGGGGVSDSRMSIASNTVAPPQNERASSWTSLDMGGMLIHNLSKELFRYTFITNLYLNHNNLTSIPPEISNLRSLVLLNLTGNKLTSIPAELGLIVSLRELLLFDNELTFLPPELGQLYQLETLGLEGNPLGDPIPGLFQKDGVTGVITYLRDMCPVGSPPAEREWVALEDSAPAPETNPIEPITVMCYNILCEKYATPQSYAYTPSWALAWDYRKDLILQDILNYNADIEMAMGQFDDYFKDQLAQLGEYEGICFPKSRAKTMGEYERRQVDGCATLFKTSKFKLLEKHTIEFQQLAMQRADLRQSEDVLNRVMVKDNIAVVAFLEHKASGVRFLVANAHLHWDTAYRDVKLIQTAMMVDEIERLLSVWLKVHPSEGPQQAPSTLLCGDFNAMADSGVYEFLSRGQVPADHEDIKDFNYKPFTSGGLSHKLALKSSYSHIENMDFTNFTPTFRGVIDYIWYSTNTLTITGLLSHVDREYVARSVGFPNAHHPSDHIPLVATFRPKQQNTNAPRKVNFKREST